VGKRARNDQILLRAFNTPPALRFWLFEGLNTAFAIIVALVPLPVHRDAEDPKRDWFLVVWSVASFAKEFEFLLGRGVEEFVNDPHSVIGLFASIMTCFALSLNVCNVHAMEPVFGLTPPPADENVTRIALGDPQALFQVWRRCDETIAPLAAREVLAIAIFLRCINSLPRIAERSLFFGPLVLTVRFMVADTLKFLLLLLWIVVSWSFFYVMLFKEPYGHATGAPSSCPNIDDEFTSFGNVFTFLVEATLDGSGHYNCLKSSSGTFLASGFMYLYVLTSTIMLINMLIAMMAESFGKVRANELEYFVFLKARQVIRWRAYAPVPPPFNLLRIPYEILWLPYALLQKHFPNTFPRISTRDIVVTTTGSTTFVLPLAWLSLKLNTIDHREALAHLCVKHVMGDEQDVTADLAEVMKVETELLKTQMRDDMVAIKEELVQAVTEKLAEEMVDLRNQLARVLQQQQQLLQRTEPSTREQPIANADEPPALSASISSSMTTLDVDIGDT